jgi:predicted transcriptional regulator
MAKRKCAASSSTRLSIFDAIRRYPGIHVRGLARNLRMEVALVQYHLRALGEDGLVESHEQGGYTRYYPTKKAKEGVVDPMDMPLLGLLREEAPLHVVLTLLDQGPLTHKELAEETGMGKSTLSYHLTKLAQAGLIERTPGTTRIQLAQRARIQRILAAYKPTPDVMSAFEELWRDLYE